MCALCCDVRLQVALLAWSLAVTRATRPVVLETNRTSLCRVGLLPLSVGSGPPEVPIVLFLPHLCGVREPDAREMLLSPASSSKPGEESVRGVIADTCQCSGVAPRFMGKCPLGPQRVPSWGRGFWRRLCPKLPGGEFYKASTPGCHPQRRGQDSWMAVVGVRSCTSPQPHGQAAPAVRSPCNQGHSYPPDVSVPCNADLAGSSMTCVLTRGPWQVPCPRHSTFVARLCGRGPVLPACPCRNGDIQATPPAPSPNLQAQRLQRGRGGGDGGGVVAPGFMGGIDGVEVAWGTLSGWVCSAF